MHQGYWKTIATSLIFICQIGNAECQFDPIAVASVNNTSKAETYFIAHIPKQVPDKEAYASCVATFQDEFIAYIQTLNVEKTKDYQKLDAIAMAARNFYNSLQETDHILRNFYAAILSHCVIPLAAAKHTIAIEITDNCRKAKHLVRGASFHRKSVQDLAISVMQQDLIE